MKVLKNWDNKTWLSSSEYISSFNSFLLKKKKLNKNSQILDIGCGRGKIFGVLSRKHKLINKPIGILNTAGYYDHLIAWMKKGVEEGFISEANFNELIITDSCEDLVEKIVSEVRPAADDWTNRLGL